MPTPLGPELEADLRDLEPGVRDRVVAFRLLIVLGGWLRTLMDRRLAPDGLTTQQAAVLTVAERVDGRPTQGEVAEALGVSHQNVRQLVTALSRKGLLAVETDPDDRRARRLAATPAARALFAARNAGDFEAVADWFGGLSDDEVDVLVQLLRRLAVVVGGERASGSGG